MPPGDPWNQEHPVVPHDQGHTPGEALRHLCLEEGVVPVGGAVASDVLQEPENIAPYQPVNGLAEEDYHGGYRQPTPEGICEEPPFEWAQERMDRVHAEPGLVTVLVSLVVVSFPLDSLSTK